MSIEKKHVFETLGVLGIIASLLFVGFELRLSRSIALNEGFATQNELAIALMSMQSENADVWQRGCLGEELTQEEKVVFGKIFAATVNYRFTLWSRANVGLMGASPERWARYVAFDRYQFTGFNEYWIEGLNRRNPDRELSTEAMGPWQADIERVYEEYVSSNTPKDLDVSYCGS